MKSRKIFVSLVLLVVGLLVLEAQALAQGPDDEDLPIVNRIGAGVVISPDGQILSMFGLPPSDLGLEGISASAIMTQVNQLGIETVTVESRGGEISLNANGVPILGLSLNLENLLGLGGEAISEETQEAIGVVKSWIEQTDASISIEIASKPSEEAPTIALGRTIEATFDTTGTLSIEGIALDFTLPGIVTETLTKSGGGVFTLDGPEGQAWTSGFPVVLDFEKGFVENAVTAFFSGTVDAPWAEQLVHNTVLNVSLCPEGSDVKHQPASYSTPQEPRGVAEMPLTVDPDNNIGVFDMRVPPQLGITPIISPFVKYLDHVDSFGVSTNGFTADIGGSSATLTMRGNTRYDMPKYLAASQGIPQPETIAGYADYYASQLDGLWFDVNLEHTEKPLPPSVLDWATGFLLPLK